MSSQKYKIKTGAIPKLTKSVKESSSLPKSDVPFINLAILPSKASSIAANKISVTARLKFPSIENFIELMPKQTPPKVKIFGKRLKKDVIVISSIAYPELFHKYISSKYNIIEIIKFKDHHKYSDYDIKKISTKLNDDVSLITTEKDAVKLCEYGELLSSYNVYYVPISIDFLKPITEFSG